jgi:hypothetical protein
MSDTIVAMPKQYDGTMTVRHNELYAVALFCISIEPGYESFIWDAEWLLGGRRFEDKEEVGFADCELLQLKKTDLYGDGTFNWRQVAQSSWICLGIV